ncbi:MAG: PAS domain S-box protein [Ferruginibacter sp.]|nr:PAS domain S-box protein [Cytophagales bacterium]
MLRKYNVERVLRAMGAITATLCLATGIALLVTPLVSPALLASATLSAGLLQISAGVLLRKRIFRPLDRLLRTADQLSGGHSPSADQVGGLSDALREVANEVREATRFAVSIGNGNLEAHFAGTQDNALRAALVEMRDKLRSLAEEEKRRLWQTNGQARFSDLLRQHLNQPDTFGFAIVKQLVNHLGCNQGGLYVLQQPAGEAPYLELTAGYAFERQKYQQRRILVGEGLLGQCIREKDTIYLTDVPADYVRITSGLGQATPRCILIVPLKVNDAVQGALELACFHPLQPYQVAFVESLAESIAASLAGFETNRGVNRLLQESRELNQRLQLQEGETQQNLVELQRTQAEMQQNVQMLQVTQDEMRHKQVELTALFNSINATLGTLEFDPEGHLFHANDLFLDLVGYQLAEIRGREHRSLFERNPATNASYADFWQRLLAKESVSDEYRVVTRDQTEMWFSASCTPALDANGHVYKIIMLAQDITEGKKERLEFQKLSLVADNTHNSVVITGPAGRIEFVNRGFAQTTGYTLAECIGQKPGTLLQGPDTDQATVARIRQAVQTRTPIYEEILNYHKDGHSYWTSLSINPVFDQGGTMDKFISVQTDITETKKNALDHACKLRAISESNAIVEFDTEGRILEANPNFLDIVGYRKEELIGQHHRLLMETEEGDSAEYRTFWQLLNQGEIIRDEFRRVTKSGGEVWLRGTYNPIFDLNGKPYKIIEFAVDITEEKRLRLATRKQEFELREYLKAINLTIASVEFDLDGRISEVNQIFLGVSGYAREDLVGKPESVLLSEEEHRKPQHGMMWENLKQGRLFSGEFKIRDRNGKELWLKGTYNPIFDPDGNPVKITMLAQFTTDEKEREMELSGVIGALKKAVLMLELNPDATFRNANQNFFDFAGYKRIELRNKELGFFLADNESFDRSIRQPMNRGEAFETRLDLTAASGRIVAFRAGFNPLTNLEGKIHKVVVVLTEE